MTTELIIIILLGLFFLLIAYGVCRASGESEQKALDIERKRQQQINDLKGGTE